MRNIPAAVFIRIHLIRQFIWVLLLARSTNGFVAGTNKKYKATNTQSQYVLTKLNSSVLKANLVTSRRTDRYMPLNSRSLNGNLDEDSNNEKRNFLKVAAMKLMGLFSRIGAFLVQFRKNWVYLYSKMTKRAKIIMAAQMMFFTVLFGGAVYHKSVIAPRYPPRQAPVEVTWSHFMDLCDWSGKGHVPGKRPAIQIKKPVVIKGDRVLFTIEQDEEKQKIALADKSLVRNQDKAVKDFSPLKVYARKPSADANLINFLRDKDIQFMAGKSPTRRVATISQFSILGMYFFIMFKMYQNMSGRGGSDSTGRIARNSINPESSVSFNDIEGIDEAKYEVMELVDALRNPGKYAILGARAPKGVLLCGPPGTGKTMLAKAVATTAGVPLLYCSGSDFVEMYVGRGAARVRRTFEKAAKLSPCIVFIDELDALGKKRNPDLDNIMGRGANDEQEQTLNQLLACMDGLDSTNGVCVLAATNRKSVLDSALTRPGRFDRIVTVPLPDAKGREAILRVHASKLPGFQEGKGVDPTRPGSLGVGNVIDLSAVASVLPGLCGAELEFIVNEAAIRAVRRVSAMLRQGVDASSIKSPQVNAEDFEGSVANYYESRGNKQGKVNIPKIMDGVFGGK